MRETGLMIEPSIIEFKKIGDEEIGYISVAEYNDNIPFEIRRVFWVYDTPPYVERGNHAHVQVTQLLIATGGSAEILLENQSGKKYTYALNSSAQGLVVPTMHWLKIHLKKNTTLLCLCSHEYNEDDYIRDYNDFKNYKN